MAEISGRILKNYKTNIDKMNIEKFIKRMLTSILKNDKISTNFICRIVTVYAGKTGLVIYNYKSGLLFLNERQ